MGIALSIVELLKRERIPYTWFRHKPTYTAQEEAAASHIRGHSWAKVVICMLDEQPVQAVLPAHYVIDLEQLRVLAGAATMRLAREDELAVLYPDYEVGAMPPFGADSRTPCVRRTLPGRRMGNGLQRRNAHRRDQDALRRFRGTGEAHGRSVLPVQKHQADGLKVAGSQLQDPAYVRRAGPVLWTRRYCRLDTLNF